MGRRFARRGVGALFAGCVLAWAAASDAQLLEHRGPPLHRVVHRHLLALRLNPQGLIYDGRFTYRHRLYASTSPALRENFIGVGLAPAASPAHVRLGPTLEFQPLTVFGVWAQVDYSRYFGTFGSLQSFPSPSTNFSDSELTRLRDLPEGDPLRPYATGGTHVTLGANLLLKLGPIVLRDAARLVRPNLDLRPGDRVFYDSTYDTLAPNRGRYLVNDLDLLARTANGKFVAGARYTATLDYYRRLHFDPLESTRHDNDSHRAGLFAAFTFFSEDGAALNNPTVFVLAQWFIRHRWRTGQDVAPSIPTVAAGVQITGDLVPLAPPAAPR